MSVRPGYTIRPAALADIPALVHHRAAMFREMHTECDWQAVATAFAAWLETHLPTGLYRAWVAEDAAGAIVAGAGIALLPWPPGPGELSGRLPYVYNVYTEPEHRRHGLAAVLMQTIHEWCRDNGYSAIRLTASVDGEPMYRQLGYQSLSQATMVLALSAPDATPTTRHPRGVG